MTRAVDRQLREAGLDAIHAKLLQAERLGFDDGMRRTIAWFQQQV